MAANCIVIDNGEPLPLDEEKFVCVDEGVEVSIESGSGYPGAGGCFFGKGKLYISNVRIVFIMERPTPVFHSFSFPFVKIKDCNIKKRLFQSKIIQGTVSPIHRGGLNGDATFKFYFPKGELTDAFYIILSPRLSESRRVSGVARVPYEEAATQCPIPVDVAFASQFRPPQPPVRRTQTLPATYPNPRLQNHNPPGVTRAFSQFSLATPNAAPAVIAVPNGVPSAVTANGVPNCVSNGVSNGAVSHPSAVASDSFVNESIFSEQPARRLIPGEIEGETDPQQPSSGGEEESVEQEGCPPLLPPLITGASEISDANPTLSTGEASTSTSITGAPPSSSISHIHQRTVSNPYPYAAQSQPPNPYAAQHQPPNPHAVYYVPQPGSGPVSGPVAGSIAPMGPSYHYNHPIFPAVYSQPIVNAYRLNTPHQSVQQSYVRQQQQQQQQQQPRGFVQQQPASDSQNGAAYIDPDDQNCLVIPIPLADSSQTSSNGSSLPNNKKTAEKKAAVITFTVKEDADDDKKPLLVETSVSEAQDFSLISDEIAAPTIVPSDNEPPSNVHRAGINSSGSTCDAAGRSQNGESQKSSRSNSYNECKSNGEQTSHVDPLLET